MNNICVHIATFFRVLAKNQYTHSKLPPPQITCFKKTLNRSVYVFVASVRSRGFLGLRLRRSRPVSGTVGLRGPGWGVLGARGQNSCPPGSCRAVALAVSLCFLQSLTQLRRVWAFPAASNHFSVLWELKQVSRGSALNYALLVRT